MRFFGAVFLAVCLMLGGRGQDVLAAPPAGPQLDPIIGKWVATTRLGNVVMEFRTDGTVAMDLSNLTANAKKNGLNPVAVAALTSRVKQSRVNWTKVGAVYRVAGAAPARKPRKPSVAKAAGTGSTALAQPKTGSASAKPGGVTAPKAAPKPASDAPTYVKIQNGKVLECDAKGGLIPGKKAMTRLN